MDLRGDVNKYIGIGTVCSEPRVKYISKLESYLIEFDFKVAVEADSGDQYDIVHPIIINNENLALFLKGTLKQGMRAYVEGALIVPVKKSKENPAYFINAHEVQLIDKIERSKYPEDIKKIR